MIIDYSWETDTDIKKQLATLISRNKLVPVIGSGFTRKCHALDGCVPSGEDMSVYLKEFAAKTYEKDISNYENSSFSDLCPYYSKRSSVGERFSYFSSNFTNVELPAEKISFLKLFPQYIYTLNIDDGIENNCKEYHVVLPRREFSDTYINTFSTVFKVHGDVHYYLQYISSEELIFNKRQYIDSIKSNGKMLSKLKDDFCEQNVLYIGCSLSEEPDLMSIVTDAIKTRRSECQAYYVTSSLLEPDKKDLLEDYGITACIIVNNYSTFYQDLLTLCVKHSMPIDPLHRYKEPQIVQVPKKDDLINFLLDSNSMIPVPFDGKIYKPSFLITRESSNAHEISKNILEALKYNSPIHIIYGHRISGKTSCLIDIFEIIKDKARYFFPSNTKIDNDTLKKLFNEKNSVFIFDTNCLEADQIFKIVTMKTMPIKPLK